MRLNAPGALIIPVPIRLRRRPLATIGVAVFIAMGWGAHPGVAAPWRFGGKCQKPRSFADAAQYNEAAKTNLAFSPFGRPETGWALYAPLVAQTIGARCGPSTPGFAKSLSQFQTAHGLSADGALSAETFQALKDEWQGQRPFFKLRSAGICPEGAVEAELVPLTSQETLGGKLVLLQPKVRRALRRMVAAARRANPETAGDPELLTVFSGYRSPTADAARCLTEQNCQGVVRAECSVHRTGLAVDLDVGALPGAMADSTADPNRLFQTQGRVYQWLIKNAGRYGFVNYAFEPWHWEWVLSNPQRAAIPPSITSSAPVT